MKRLSVTLLLAGTLLLTGAATAWACTPVRGPAVVASFDPGTFAESLTVDRTGNLLVSLTRWGDTVNSGEVWCLRPCGRRTLLATIDVGPGLLTGIARDNVGRVYVVAATTSDTPLPGVYRIGAGGKATRVMTLPAESFPNGIAIHDGFIYVSDSWLGEIWRAPLGCSCSPPTAWFSEAHLMPTTLFGVNGIAFWRNELFMAVSDSGRIFQVDVKPNGSAGTLRPVISATALCTADGIAFDAQGGLWITTNSGGTAAPFGGLFRLSPAGVLTTIASNPGWLDYPTMPAFGTADATRTTLYVANGSLEIGTPNIISLDAGVTGCRLN